MKIEPFKLERFFARYEFKVDRQLSASDCRSISIKELLEESAAAKVGRPIAAVEPDDPLSGLASLDLGYTESRGDPELRDAISHLYGRIKSENVLVAAPEEAIFLFFHAHLQAGDHVIVMGPSYQSLESVPRSIGCEVDRWMVEVEKGQWRLDFDRLEALLSKRTKLLVVNLPHNPTGYCMQAEEKKTLVEMLRRRGITLFSDEMYRQLEYDKRADALAFCDMYERAVSLSGLSKAHGLPGLRIGWLAAQDPRLIDPAAELKDYTTICSAAPAEYLAKAALSINDRLVKRSLATIRQNLQRLEDTASRLSGRIELLPGMGGSVVFPRFIDGTSAGKLSLQLIEERSLLLLPGNLFDMPEEHFRIGLGRGDLAEALALLEQELGGG